MEVTPATLASIRQHGQITLEFPSRIAAERFATKLRKACYREMIALKDIEIWQDADGNWLLATDTYG